MKKPPRYLKRPYHNTPYGQWVYYKYANDRWYRMYEAQGYWLQLPENWKFMDSHSNELVDVNQEEVRIAEAK